MLTSDVFRVGIIVNFFWVFIALFLNNRWYKYSLKLNDEWAEICERLCSEIEDYYTKEEEDVQPQSEVIRCKDCMHNGSFDTDCPINWNGKEYCSFAERRTDE